MGGGPGRQARNPGISCFVNRYRHAAVRYESRDPASHRCDTQDHRRPRRPELTQRCGTCLGSQRAQVGYEITQMIGHHAGLPKHPALQQATRQPVNTSTPEMRCVDLGCGGGEVTIQIARLVAPRGSVTGVDLDQVKSDLARQSASQRAAVGLQRECCPLACCAVEVVHLVGLKRRE
jgi:SAM-dependent methyltransferase